jgi:hypothetical protein
MKEAELIAGLLALGGILKTVLNEKARKWIPVITWSVGIVLWCLAHGWSEIGRAILVAAAATGVHSATKNTIQGIYESATSNDDDGNNAA